MAIANLITTSIKELLPYLFHIFRQVKILIKNKTLLVELNKLEWKISLLITLDNQYCYFGQIFVSYLIYIACFKVILSSIIMCVLCISFLIFVLLCFRFKVNKGKQPCPVDCHVKKRNTTLSKQQICKGFMLRIQISLLKNCSKANAELPKEKRSAH